MEQRTKGAQIYINSLLTAQLVTDKTNPTHQKPIQRAKEQSKGANQFRF